MRSKIATKLLNEMSEEQKKKLDKEADKLVLSNVSERLYSMKLHEVIEEEVEWLKWHITRVPSGWIYNYIILDSGQMNTVFVPFDNRFENAR